MCHLCPLSVSQHIHHIVMVHDRCKEGRFRVRVSMMVLCSGNGTIQLNINHTKRTIVGLLRIIKVVYIILFYTSYCSGS